MSAYVLQNAIYDKLTSLSVPVYDDVPEEAVLPYVVIGDDTITDDNTDTQRGYIATVTVHAWTDSRGRKEAKQLQDEINGLLDGQELTMTGFDFVNSYQEFNETLLDPDGITRHGVQRFRVIFYKK